MHMAALNTSDDYTAWLAAHTAYCKRHRTSLTVAACEQNQEISAGHNGDLRCNGCQGLHNQTGEVRDPFKLNLAYPCKPAPEELTEPEPEAVRISEAPEAETALDPEDLSALDDLELGLDDETLAALTNGNSVFCRELQQLLQDESAPETIELVAEQFRQVKLKEQRRLYAVYKGRCPRCSGYMDGTREIYGKTIDDNVSRCLACGYRTSPAYEWNRANPHNAGWKG